MLYFDMLPIGYKISQKRREYGMTQAKLAQRAGLAQPNLSNIEKGKQDLTVTMLIRIAKALGVAPGVFFWEEKKHDQRLTRTYVEYLAESVWKTAVCSEEDRPMVQNLRTLLPGGLKRPAGRAAVERAWLELRSCFTPAEIKLLCERARDARQRAEMKS